MGAAAEGLEELRREIDTLDDQIHDLVMRRAEVVGQIGRLKERAGVVARVAHRPGREALLIRRLIARHRGAFPKTALARIYREVLGATTRVQGRFAVAVYRSEDRPGYWDLARDHYGSWTPLSAFSSPAQVIAQVSRGEAAIGVLPLPRDDDEELWWPRLLAGDGEAPRIVARLPFAGYGSPRGGGDIEALAIAAEEPDESGDDRSLIVLAGEAEISRARLYEALDAAGLAPSQMLEGHEPAQPGGKLHLVDVAGVVGADDPRLAALPDKLGDALHRIIRLGGYATPLAAADLA